MKIGTVEVELKAKDVDKIKENIFLKEIVRCKDCKYNTTVEHNPVCAVFGVPMDVNDYCSYGERKEDE